MLKSFNLEQVRPLSCDSQESRKNKAELRNQCAVLDVDVKCNSNNNTQTVVECTTNNIAEIVLCDALRYAYNLFSDIFDVKHSDEFNELTMKVNQIRPNSYGVTHISITYNFYSGTYATTLIGSSRKLKWVGDLSYYEEHLFDGLYELYEELLRLKHMYN